MLLYSITFVGLMIYEHTTVKSYSSEEFIPIMMASWFNLAALIGMNLATVYGKAGPV
jgi:hypothetical protein